MEVERYREQERASRKKPSKRTKARKTRVQKSRSKKPRAQRVTKTKKPSTHTRTKRPEQKIEEDYSEKYNSIKSQLNSLSLRTRNLPSKIDQFDLKVKEISNRINKIRQNNYLSNTNFESDYEVLNKNWETDYSIVLNSNHDQVNSFLRRKDNLENRLNISKNMSDFEQIEVQLTNFAQSVAILENSVNNQLKEHQDRYNSINNDLKIVENTLIQLENSSIEWKKNEHPILAIRAKDLTNDKQGVLALTNFRILFEEVKEIVLRKSLFIATEKKTVKEVTIDQPIGAIDVIEQGKVGFLKGAGLFLKFKPQIGLEELKIDTSGSDDEKFIQYYTYIISGEAEKELAPILDENADSSIPMNCPNCSAPYTEEILLGQTSIKCLYCGTVIKL
jgi:hypothetical protein